MYIGIYEYMDSCKFRIEQATFYFDISTGPVMNDAREIARNIWQSYKYVIFCMELIALQNNKSSIK